MSPAPHAPAPVDFRRLLEQSWSRRRGGLAKSGAPAAAPAGAALRRRLFQALLRELDHPGAAPLDRARVAELLAAHPESAALPRSTRDRLGQELLDEAGGLGPLASLLRDPTVSDVLVNGPDEVWVERFGRLERSTVRFDDEAHLERLLRRLAAAHGRRLDANSPHVDVRLLDGARLNAILPPIARRGAAASFRQLRMSPFTLDELVAFGTLSRELGDLLAGAVEGKRNVVIAGSSGAGKTTMLNALSHAIPHHERVVTIEETAELRLAHPHVISLEARPPNGEGQGEVTVRTLVRNALRMRADRILVGEVRGPEAFEMLQAMLVGHDGSLTTVHAGSPRDALRRLQSLVAMGGSELPAAAVADLLGSAIDLIVQLVRFPDGTRRVTRVHAVRNGQNGIEVQELASYRAEEGRFALTAAGEEAWRRRRQPRRSEPGETPQGTAT